MADRGRRPALTSAFLPEECAATAGGAAAAGKAAFGRWRMPLVEHIRVIVRELLSGRHVPNSLDPDAAIVDDGIAVRIAGVVDESGVVTVDGCVDHDVL